MLSKASEWKRPRRLQSVDIGEIEEKISPDQGRCNDNVFFNMLHARVSSEQTWAKKKFKYVSTTQVIIS